MFSLMKSFISFSIFILILSMSYNDKTIFHYVYKHSSKISVPMQNLISDAINLSLNSTKKISNDLFNNSVPKVKDSIKSKLSAPLKGEEMSENVGDLDKKKLDQLLKN